MLLAVYRLSPASVSASRRLYLLLSCSYRAPASLDVQQQMPAFPRTDHAEKRFVFGFFQCQVGFDEPLAERVGKRRTGRHQRESFLKIARQLIRHLVTVARERLGRA